MAKERLKCFHHLINKFQNRSEPEKYLCHQAQDTTEF